MNAGKPLWTIGAGGATADRGSPRLARV